jgi:hypothetical protein
MRFTRHIFTLVSVAMLTGCGAFPALEIKLGGPTPPYGHPSAMPAPAGQYQPVSPYDACDGPQRSYAYPPQAPPHFAGRR